MARGGRHRFEIHKRGGAEGGVSYQIPKDWDDGSGKIRHIPSGPLKGRVYFTSRHEAQEIAKRLQDKEQTRVRFDS
jgi:hypothetical protein